MNAVPLPSYAGSRAASLVIIVSIGLGVLGCMGINEYLESLAIGCCEQLSCRQVNPGSDSTRDTFAGNFNGTLLEASCAGYDALSTDPVHTSLTRSPDGTLQGEYRVQEAFENYRGKLVQQGPVTGRHVTFRWTDKFGKGTLEADFDDDFCQFEGKWRNDEGTMLDEPWNGHKY